MKQRIIYIIITFFTFIPVSAEDLQIIAKENHNVRLLKTIALSEDKYVYVTVRDEGHVLGQNFLVQIRASCDGKIDDFTKLKVIDSHSVCNLKPDSVKVNLKNTAVAMLSKSANINQYYEDTADGLIDPKMNCNEKTEILKFSFKNICSK